MLSKIQRDMKGITLIPLVITIIVLLILAAVSIATLTGENGLLQSKGTECRRHGGGLHHHKEADSGCSRPRKPKRGVAIQSYS